MTRDEAIEQLEALQAARRGSRLYLPIGAAPELMIPRGAPFRAYITWEGSRWVACTARTWATGMVTRDETVECDTLAECVDWLEGRR